MSVCATLGRRLGGYNYAAVTADIALVLQRSSFSEKSLYMKYYYTIKALAAASTLILVMPFGGAALIPFGFSYFGFVTSSRWIDKLLSIGILILFLYMIISAGFRFKGLVENIVTILICLIFLTYIGSHYIDFYYNHTFLSDLTGCVSIILFIWTLALAIKRLKQKLNRSRMVS